MKMIVLSGEKAKTQNFYEPEVVILGGGLSGIAAALAICYTGRSATIIEESDHITGCFPGAGPFAFSENPLLETSGSTKMYRDFHQRILDWYAGHSKTPPSPPSAFSAVSGLGFNSFCFDTEAAQAVIDDNAQAESGTAAAPQDRYSSESSGIQGIQRENHLSSRHRPR